MPLTIISPPHSFVQFDGSLPDTLLPAVDGPDVAFQFQLGPDMKLPLDTPVFAGVAYVNGSPLNVSFLTENVCALGQFEQIDFESDFPITVADFPLAGYYETPDEFLQKVSAAYGITATGQDFLQCCSLDALPTIEFQFNNGRTGGVSFYKGLQWVKLTGGWDVFAVQPGQCYRYCVKVGNETVASNIFQRVASSDFLTEVTYSGNEDAFGFTYRAISVIAQEDATPPTGNQALVAGVQAPSWNSNGAKIYAPGFPLNGLGTEVAHLTTPHFWVNGDTPVDIVNGSPSGNNNDGRMNPNGVWVNNNTAPGTVWQPTDEWIGFSRKITLTGPQWLYVGISGDNCVRLKINGVEILNTDGSDVFNPASGISFLTWSIYPVYFSQPVSYLEMLIKNTSVSGTSNPAGFACEVYNMTAAELQAARSEADLKIIFRTRDMIGQPFDVGTTIGYSCRDGWSLTKDSAGRYICVQTQQGDYTLNRLWLPILLKKPSYPESRRVYKKSSGLFKVLSAVIEKKWQCKTEVLPDEMHQKIAVMLAHDNIHFRNKKIDSDVFKTDDYDIGWPEDDAAEVATATFNINTPFAGRNSNCVKPRACLPAIQPVECVPVTLDASFVFPDAALGTPYSATQQILSGSGPLTVAVQLKPSWMTVTAQGTTALVYSGTPDATGGSLVSVTIANCDTTLGAFVGPINVGTSGGQNRSVTGTIGGAGRRLAVTVNAALPDDLVLDIDAGVDLNGVSDRVGFTVTIPKGATSAGVNTTGGGLITCVYSNDASGTYTLPDLQAGQNHYAINLTINSTVC